MNKNSKIFLIKKEINENGNIIYKEYSDGYWIKREYDKNDNLTLEINSNNEILFDIKDFE